MSTIALDPLIAEAKRRTQRRRLVLVAATIAGVAIAGYGLGPGGWIGGSRFSNSASSEQSLAHLVVPLDGTERQWRSRVRAGLTPADNYASSVPAFRRRAMEIARDTGAVPIRVKIWPGATPAAVEIVAATAMDPAAYLRHRAAKWLSSFPRPIFVKIVNPSGSRIFEWGGVGNEGFVGTAPGLDNCSPVRHWGLARTPPCPVR